MPTEKRSPQRDPNAGQRGEVVKSGGNKVHGDDLEGMIPNKPLREPRSTRDDGDNNNNKGELE